MNIKIFCDGSCLDNASEKNYGGYGVIMVVNEQVHSKYKKGFKDTTNNRMELEGLITSIKIAKHLEQDVSIYCDSSYCVNIANSWMFNWFKNGWRKPDKKTPENLDLIQELYGLLNFEKNIHIIKTKGHSDNEFNNLADELARSAAKEARDKGI